MQIVEPNDDVAVPPSRWTELNPRRLFFPLCAIACALVVLLIVGCWEFYTYTNTDELEKRDQQIRRAFKAVRPGMSRHEVVQLMGEPRRQSTEFYLSQYQGFEKEYERAHSSGSAYYLIWNSGFGITYAIGFDTNDKVTMKAFGGS